MKKILVPTLLALSTQASAQEAKIERFTTEGTPTFALLIPSVSDPQETQDTQEADQADPELVLPIAEQLAQDLSPFASSDLGIAPYIPSWMRIGGSPFQATTMVQPTYFPSADCLTEGYFPRFDISEEAQARRRLYFNDILKAACEAGVPVRLFDALVSQESRYRPFARSHAGAMGMAQLMPGTAKYLRVSDPWDPAENLRGGARYLREQLDRFGSWDLALASYNAGPGRVQQYRGIPPFRETRNYVRTIMASLDGSARPFEQYQAPASNPFRKVHLASFGAVSEVPEY